MVVKTEEAFCSHGGQKVSHHLRDVLHERFETVDKNLVHTLVNWLKSFGKSGYGLVSTWSVVVLIIP
jgi:hypothetical protein